MYMWPTENLFNKAIESHPSNVEEIGLQMPPPPHTHTPPVHRDPKWCVYTIIKDTL